MVPTPFVRQTNSGDGGFELTTRYFAYCLEIGHHLSVEMSVYVSSFQRAFFQHKRYMPIVSKAIPYLPPYRNCFFLCVCHCRIFDRIPRIILETVYLDQDMRVSRLPDQNFLIYVKDY